MTPLRAFLARLLHRAAARLDPTIVEPLGNRTWLRMELESMNSIQELHNLDGLVEFPFGRFTSLTRKER